ncbi:MULTISPECIES: hypothetical protein [unclassified Rhizobium]|uniref:hypothetical protein n=1 Tax=unclassified Rhizobium TaxID=2613769 RepID=UPI0006FEA6E6|nr:MULTISPECIES: hypothetical protein [unclassified Rhizobium]KQV39196.1 hypothetical protein ASC86_23295 [Rhizobium sp. Root1212]KRD35170.1 hypothetical protein ASE37_21865 [Rhizobium sp. Root268]
MPNTPVPAAAGGMPKFYRSQIMRDAWALYRQDKAYIANNTYLAGAVASFSASLKEAWRRAKAAAAKRAVSAAVAARIDELKSQLVTLESKSFRYRIGFERGALVSQLMKLEREAA